MQLRMQQRFNAIVFVILLISIVPDCRVDGNKVKNIELESSTFLKESPQAIRKRVKGSKGEDVAIYIYSDWSKPSLATANNVSTVVHRNGLKTFGINVDEQKEAALSFVRDIESLPIFGILPRKSKGKMTIFADRSFTLDDLQYFIDRMRQSPLTKVHDEYTETVQRLLSKSKTLVVGYFRTLEASEELEELEDTARERRGDLKVNFIATTEKQLSIDHKRFKKIPKRSPALAIFTEGESSIEFVQASSMDELDSSISSWIDNSIARNGVELSVANFPYFEKRNLPMFILFVDTKASETGKLIKDFNAVMEQYSDSVIYAWCNGVLYGQLAASLGVLVHSKENPTLPTLAVNAKDPRKFALYRDTLLRGRALLKTAVQTFVGDYLKGSLKPVEANAGVQTSESRKSGFKKSHRHSEVIDPFGDYVSNISSTEEFNQVVMDMTKDVVVKFQRSSCPQCAAFDPYFRVTCRRFKELQLNHIVFVRVNVDDIEVPKGLRIHAYPAVYIFPADDKSPPFRAYMGKGKVSPMMEFVHKYSSVPFQLPELFEFNEKEKRAYLEQTAAIMARKEKKQEEL